jgi:uncharacterized protein YndB with AHSA1/START domain
MRPKGSLREDGEYATLVFHRRYPHAVEHVWEAIATPAGLREWLLCSHAVIEGRMGGRIELVSGPAQYRSTGRILVWAPPRLLEYEWNVDPVPEMPRGEHAIFRYELIPHDAATELVVTYRRITKETAGGFLPGLHAFLDRLEAQLNESALPDWTRRFGEVRESYPEWKAYASRPEK